MYDYLYGDLNPFDQNDEDLIVCRESSKVVIDLDFIDVYGIGDKRYFYPERVFIVRVEIILKEILAYVIVDVRR